MGDSAVITNWAVLFFHLVVTPHRKWAPLTAVLAPKTIELALDLVVRYCFIVHRAREKRKTHIPLTRVVHTRSSAHPVYTVCQQPLNPSFDHEAGTAGDNILTAALSALKGVV